ncbi:hypothetical protein [Bradyrhizobium sp. Tv2a-2]|nr:hypothetical protein [Bradyrhizobium sp. Tv2a-2]
MSTERNTKKHDAKHNDDLEKRVAKLEKQVAYLLNEPVKIGENR